jgi:putative transposase
MPRKPRLHVPGGLYHAILRGNHRQVIFQDEGDHLTFEDILATALSRYAAGLHAYCWMPNHVHLAVQVGEAPLGRLMQLLASRYARRKQREIPTTGHLFERRYRAKLVQTDRYLLALVRYIHLNPVRAGLTADPAAYRWSSHRAYMGLAPTGRLLVEPALDLLAGSRVVAAGAYLKYMGEDPSPDELVHIHPSMHPPRREGVAQPLPTGEPEATSRDLEAIVLEVAGEFGVADAAIRSDRRLHVLVRARTEIARRALREGVATLSQVATRLGRSPSTLSEGLGKPGTRR